MAFARFFSKAALSASSILQGFDYEDFKESLRSVRVGVVFDAEAVSSKESRWTLELLVNLLARLYPELTLIRCDDSDKAIELEAVLSAAATEINPALHVETGTLLGQNSNAPSIVVAVGASRMPDNLGFRHVIYLGSNEWEVRIGGAEPWRAGTSALPFAAGAAACLAAAAVFRTIFSAQLPQPSAAVPSPDKRFEPASRWSLLTLTTMTDCPPGTVKSNSATRDNTREQSVVDVGEIFLVGVGAIGNGAVWALSRAETLAGMLWLIDDELIDVSNLQRYVLTADESEGLSKVAVAGAQFRALTNAPESLADADAPHRLSVTQVASTWNVFVDRRSDYRFDRVLLALDSAEDRIAAQASLPRWIANAWTQAENLGISRHPDFVQDACAACPYMPTEETKSREQLICEALRVDTDFDRVEIKKLLHLGQSVGEDFVRRVATRFGVCDAELLPFAQTNLDAFYAGAICGGLLVKLGAHQGLAKSAVVPMAFQSALAGILLAAEAVLSAIGGHRSGFAGRTEIDLRRPLGGRLNSPTAKSPTGRCICQDTVYLRAYQAKYIPL